MSCQVCRQFICICDKVPLTPHTLAALKLALDALRRVAWRCVDCKGTGELIEIFEAFILTDDERLTGPPFIRIRRAAEREGATAEKSPRGAGRLVRPCPACRDVRQVVETAGGSL